MMTKSVQTPTQSTVKPAERGALRCLCHGKLLVMLGHYGWIMSLREVDHPDSEKNGGRIYVHKKDIKEGTNLKAGDTVIFYLYVDERGLGAEGCHVLTRWSGKTCKNTIKARASERSSSVPAMRKKPTSTQDAHPASGMDPTAKEFVPSVFCLEEGLMDPVVADFGMDPMAQEFVPNLPIGAKRRYTYSVNAPRYVYESDDCDSDGSTTDAGDDTPCRKFGKPHRRSDCDLSTTEGSLSDSEESLHLSYELALESPPGLTKLASPRMSELSDCLLPPGLEMPLELPPPPGLPMIPGLSMIPGLGVWQ